MTFCRIGALVMLVLAVVSWSHGDTDGAHFGILMSMLLGTHDKLNRLLGDGE